MIIKTPTPNEITEYTKLGKISWWKLQSEEHWISSNTRFWSFGINKKELIYFRIQPDRTYIVDAKIKTEGDIIQLFEYVKQNFSTT